MTTHIHPDSQWVVPMPPQQLTPQMTLLDYFAGQAMLGDWAAQSEETGIFTLDTPDEYFKKSATLYYRMATAMLKERKRLQKEVADVGQTQT